MPGLLEFIILALAAYRLTRLFIEDVIFDTPRDAIWKKFPPESTKIGYLLTCYWCLGLWVSGLVVVLYLLIPVPTLVVAAILAISAVVGMIDHRMNN